MKYKILGAILFCGCASIQPLSGGDKDETPPIITSTSIDSAATNVNSTITSFTFDEYVVLKSITQNFLISPNQIKTPTFKLKKKTLTITLNDSLLDNTTYSFQFNGAVVDLNESNPLDYKYIFSTGAYIDSAVYSGYVIDYTSKKPCNECNLQLYTTSEDSFFLKTKPNFIAKTDTGGRFNFTNLPNQTFIALAIQDENNNLFWSDKEKISLYKSITTSDSTKNDTFYIFENQNKQKLKVKLSHKTPGKYIFTANNLFLSDTFRLLFNGTEQPYSIQPYKDTITTYYTKTSDSLTIQFITPMDTQILKDHRALSTLKYTNSISYSQSPNTIRINSRTPIAYIDSSAFNLLADDSTFIPFRIKQINEQRADITYTEKDIKKLKLFYEPTAITDVYNQLLKNDSAQFNITNDEPSIVNVTLNGTDTTVSYILQIRKGKRILRQYIRPLGSTINLESLKPDTYTIVTVTDNNGDGVWTTGDIWTESSPEPLQISKPFEIRKNWDNELIINVQ